MWGRAAGWETATGRVLQSPDTTPCPVTDAADGEPPFTKTALYMLRGVPRARTTVLSVPLPDVLHGSRRCCRLCHRPTRHIRTGFRRSSHKLACCLSTVSPRLCRSHAGLPGLDSASVHTLLNTSYPTHLHRKGPRRTLTLLASSDVVRLRPTLLRVPADACSARHASPTLS